MILDEIFETTKQALEKQKKELPYDMLGRSLASNPFFPKDVKSALKRQGEEIRVIAEVKKASPSKGIIREDFEPLNIALNYEKNNASAISVLTEPFFFKGELEYLSMIRRYTKIPLLRKDFIFDEYQLLQALVYGADFALLIAKMLSKKELKKLLEFARHLGLEVLVEIHDLNDLTKAIFAGADIIGINHRDLNDFSMHLDLCDKLIPHIPNSKIIVAESGLSNDKNFIKHLQKCGVDAFLVGEYFMRQKDEGLALKEFIGE
ncbi:MULTISPECIES: indole-3-glycerol phosphate synthase TrpC [unclassified Campylobacter]|uniref:indole-3-glycerol phosphate synthase TrpC n=1 Tax=unclassified Campylobacter TaxID=2593542 RepID=UPI00123813CA|nr:MULTISPECIES: indole-3-glycerol phosphate synthase TrpC [unclassified Campylobacter]KAA6226435.1 indole-3-glycerol phosphate synthase TrpC [Campylobacter sp. LR286c]KAA6226527.1 indole-3-glycerol phosphate synthase TrpC [Campylobacter sp. LR185c]KAA6226923.1 indole-3-glycerol phosphate synthase TrpC [Campylobacter sp. LR196d]KAA6233667.1 indole-3-glycerol phosphate synthase TrpC [Campylobacter sp. LR291e]KAA8603666.1 indole-3-glycerol phosphate synthase [Campylobacter sp. LR185c]